MTVEFEGNWVQATLRNDKFESEDRQDFESGSRYWLMDIHGQIERVRLVHAGKKDRINPRARYLDLEHIIGWIPDDKKTHISRLMTDGDYKGEDWVLFTGGAV